MPETDQHRLIGLLAEAGPAHQRAYFAANGADPDWPPWYAEYLQARLNQMLGTALTRSELTDLLVLVETNGWPATCRRRRGRNAVQSGPIRYKEAGAAARLLKDDEQT